MPIVKQIFYEKNPDIQRSGIDAIIERKEPNIEIKTRHYSYHRFNDILIETISIVKDKKPGWLYTSKADYVIYLWYDSNKDDILDAYIIILKELRDWLLASGVLTTFRVFRASSNRDGAFWETDNISIPISDFSKNILIKIDKDKLISKGQTQLSVEYSKSLQQKLFSQSP